jgi:integrase
MRGKRGQGTIIVRPDGRYQAAWSGGRDGEGKRIRKYATFVLRGDAEWWLRESVRSGQPPEDETVAEYLERWLAAVGPTIEASTLRSYRDHVEHHIVPMLGPMRIRALQTRHVNALIADRLRHVADRTHKPLSPTTVRLIVTTLRTALAAGVRAHELPDNVAIAASLPRVTERRIEPMTEADARLLLRAVRKTWAEYIVRLLFGSSIRLGEACSLNQGDLRLDVGQVQLRSSKTDIRAVDISDDAVRALRSALAAAPRRGKAEPVFFGPRPNRAGNRERLRGSSLSHALPRMLEDAGIDRLTPHGLRHGAATLMLADGASMEVIAAQLGHRSKTTTKRYAHVARTSQREALRSLDRAAEEG